MATAVQEFNSGMNILGYRFIPEATFDSAGNIVLPSDFQAPPEWNDTVGRIVVHPAWSDLFKILGVMTTQGGWWCWRVAVAFASGEVRVLFSRPRTANPQVDLNWSNNFWNVVIPKMKSYAGRRYLLPAGLGDALSGVAGSVRDSGYWSREPNPKWTDKQKAEFIAKRDALKWRVSTALDLFAHLAAAAGQATMSGKVLATGLWYDGVGGAVDPGQLGGFAPLHQTYTGWAQRHINYWWNFNCRAPSKAPGQFAHAPVIYSTAVQRTGLGVTNVAHQPWDMAAAMYPDGDFRPKTLTDAGPAPDDAAGVADPTDYTLVADTSVSAEIDAILDTGAPAPAGSMGPALVAAHSLPDLGGGFLVFGSLIDGVFRCDDGAALPPTVWLPGVGVLASREPDRTFKVAGQLPPAILAPRALGAEGD